MLTHDLPSSAKEAKALGAKYYFTGKPCQRDHVSKRYAHGSCVACKEEDRAKNSEASAAYSREWRKGNPEKCAAYHAKQKASGWREEYEQKNKDKKREYRKKWYANNLERAKEHTKAWRLANLEYCRERSKKYKSTPEQRLAFRQKNRELLAERSRAWRKNNPDKARIVDINKKAMRRSAIGRFTKDDVQKRLVAQKNRCGWCRVKIIAYHVDHITPLSRGGTNLPNNIQILCPDCNMRKHNADPVDFARREGRLI